MSIPGSPIRFKRYYNSSDAGTTRLSTGWRNSYSRSITQRSSLAGIEPYTADVFDSQAFPTEQTACENGFDQIKRLVSNWQNATATFASGVCTLSVGGVTIGTIQVMSGSAPLGTVSGFDVTRDDGQVITLFGSGSTWSPVPGLTLRLDQTSTGFTITDSDDNVETYDSNGKLLSITSRGGVVQTLSYDGYGRLSGVSDSFGNAISVGYDFHGFLGSVTGPDGKAVQYAYDSSNRFATVTNPDGTTRNYVYEDSSHTNYLTGVIDESNNRNTTWTYDAQGRGISSSQGSGANVVSLTYNADGSTTVTDALGAVRVFTYGRWGDLSLVTSISGSQCPTCTDGLATTYDLEGFVSSRTDYNGNVTQYTYDDSRGLETSRTEAVGTAQARTVTTRWHSTYRLPMQIALYAGGAATGAPLKTTSFTYDGNGNLLTKTVADASSSRTWTYTYDSFGHVLTADGPRTDVADVTTYTYYSCTSGAQCGQLHTITDAAQHVTTYNTYNAYGQPLTITNPNGALITFAYDARQRLTSRTVAWRMGTTQTTETTGFAYYPTGLLQTVTLPDGSSLTYTYDTAQRLTQISDGLGNKVVYTLD